MNIKDYEYKYKEIEDKAFESSTKENLENLWKWFEAFGNDYWNGECYTVRDDYGLYPIYEMDGEDAVIIDYEIRR